MGFMEVINPVTDKLVRTALTNAKKDFDSAVLKTFEAFPLPSDGAAAILGGPSGRSVA